MAKNWVIVLAAIVGAMLLVPKIAQFAIDQATFHIANSTVYGVPANEIPGFANNFNGWVYNSLRIHNPMPLGAKIHEANVSMIINMPNVSVDHEGFSSGTVGWFTMPETTMKHGDNLVEFTRAIHFNSTADNGFRFASWAFYVFLQGVVYVDIVAEPKLTALGFVTVQTKLKKTLACNCINGSDACTFQKPKPEKFQIPADFWEGDDMFLEPRPDNMTMTPPVYPNASIAKNQGYLPTAQIFCEPVDVDVSGNTQMAIAKERDDFDLSYVTA